MRLEPDLSVIQVRDYTGKQKHWDLFLACSSFEERCTGASRELADKGTELDHAIVFSYKETDPYGLKDGWQHQMVEQLNKTSKDVRVFNTESVSKPSEGMKGFLRYLRGTRLDPRNSSILIDITVFTKPYYFLLIKTLCSEYSIGQLDIMYSEPEHYGSKPGTVGAVVLTEGLDRIETIPGFTGSSSGTEEALVVLMGFEGNRSLDVFRAVNPTTTYAVNGFPSFRPGWDRISLDANLRFLRESSAYDALYFAAAIDPFETRDTLGLIEATIRERNPDSSIVIAPLGTKTQALGVLLHAIRSPGVKVIYPFPSHFRTDYSSGIGPCWMMRTRIETAPGVAR